MKKVLSSLLIATTLLAVSGCSTPKPADSLTTAMENLINTPSYTFQSNTNLQVTVPDVLANQPEAAAFAPIVDNVDISIDGIYVKDPQQYELDVKIVTTGDVGYSFHLPIIITKDKMWIKIPSNYAGMFGLNSSTTKFYEIDLKETESSVGVNLTPAEAEKLGLQIAKIVVEEYTGTIFKSISAKDAGLEKSDVENVTRLSITNDNVESAINVAVKKVAPKVLELLRSDNWKEKFKLTEDDIVELQEKIDMTDEEIKEAANDFGDMIQINAFTSDIGTNKKNQVVYTSFTMDVDIVDSALTEYDKKESTGNVTLSSTATFNNFGEKQDFKFGIPNEEDIIRD